MRLCEASSKHCACGNQEMCRITHKDMRELTKCDFVVYGSSGNDMHTYRLLMAMRTGTRSADLITGCWKTSTRNGLEYQSALTKIGSELTFYFRVNFLRELGNPRGHLVKNSTLLPAYARPYAAEASSTFKSKDGVDRFHILMYLKRQKMNKNTIKSVNWFY